MTVNITAPFNLSQKVHFMTTSSATNLNRRSSPRAVINSQIKYRVKDQTSYCAGKLLDLSQTGVLLELRHKLPENTRISIVTKLDDTDESPIEVTAEIVRQEITNDGHYSYGCIILDVINL